MRISEEDTQRLEALAEEIATKALSSKTKKEVLGAESQLYRSCIDAVQSGILAVALKQFNGNQSVVSKALGINRATMRKHCIRHGHIAPETA